MSTIEKAIEKLGQQAASSTPEQESVDRDFFTTQEETATIERASQPESVVSEHSASVERDDSPAEILDLPFAQLVAKGMINPQNPRSMIAEQYRAIKRPLIRNIAGDGADAIESPNLIMVTSCFEGEGKTFSAVNLMLSMSMESDKTVLFIDADVAKASSSRLLGVPEDAPGLIDVLQYEDVGIEDVLLQSSIPNIRVIPAGHVNDRSTELLASNRMQQVMTELSGRYSDRIIIFDSPPLLQTSEASVLANLMGQIVFVVEAEKTAREAVTQAVDQISDDKVVGMVLNKARKYPWDGRLYGQGYGYGYGYERTRGNES